MYAAIAACFFLTSFAKAQTWNAYVSTTSGNNYDQCDETKNLESVGVGDFNGNGTNPKSAFEINTNYMGYLLNATSYPLGEVFRTNCPEDISTYWRMWRVLNGIDQEFGNLFCLNINDDFLTTETGEGVHFYMQASGSDPERDIFGDIRFTTGQVDPERGLGLPRMRILGTNGFVGIGNFTTFLPKSLLHVHDSYLERGDSYAQFTNEFFTGDQDLDGFKVGVAALDANLIQQENAPMEFYT